MNFLAHLYLSGNDENLLFGNFIGDSVKGQQYLRFSEEVQKGILLHRFIDHYTDSHPLVKESCKRLYPKFKRYSGIINDIIYDYFLANNWQLFHEEELKIYCQKTYDILGKKRNEMPGKSGMFFDYMISTDRLYNYKIKSELKIVLRNMGNRIAAPYPLPSRRVLRRGRRCAGCSAVRPID